MPVRSWSDADSRGARIALVRTCSGVWPRVCNVPLSDRDTPFPGRPPPTTIWIVTSGSMAASRAAVTGNQDWGERWGRMATDSSPDRPHEAPTFAALGPARPNTARPNTARLRTTRLRTARAAGAVPGIVGSLGGAASLIQFILVWLGVWLVANGPMRVPFIRWRFLGGRIV